MRGGVRRRGAARRPCAAPTQVAGRRTGMRSEQAAHGIIVASYRRRMGVVAAREMARHRWRHAQLL